MDAMKKHILDDEQHAPFTMPTWQEIERMRRGVEQVKRKNAEASPLLRLINTHEGNNEL